MARDDLDCQACGACCVNPASNEAEGFRSWVEVGEREPLLRRKDLVKKLVVLHDDVPHLRLDATGRCLALRGRVGDDVSCSIYALRPHPCRRVQPGDAGCLSYRRELGLDRA